MNVNVLVLESDSKSISENVMCAKSEANAGETGDIVRAGEEGREVGGDVCLLEFVKDEGEDEMDS